MKEREINFHDSLKLPVCPNDYSVLLQALWHDGKGNWHTAHDLINDLAGKDEAWVHAYLHRKEGDLGNADYWYRRAGKSRPNFSLGDEWWELVSYFCCR